MLDVLLVLAGMATAAGAWGLAIEPRLLRVRHHRIVSRRWPGHWPELRVAVLSDLHAAWPHTHGRRLDAVVRRILDEKPDLVLLPGDFVSTRSPLQWPLTIEAIAEALAPLARCPVVATLGNHDHEHDGRHIAAALRSAGIEVLYNAASRLPWGDAFVQIVGIPYPGSDRFDVRTGFAGLDPALPIIVNSHTPDSFPHLPAEVMLTVAGHTHGGQVKLPGLPPPVTFSRLPRRMAHGLHRQGERHLYVSAGIGMSGPPIRFGVPPEIAILTVASTSAKAVLDGHRGKRDG